MTRNKTGDLDCWQNHFTSTSFSSCSGAFDHTVSHDRHSVDKSLPSRTGNVDVQISIFSEHFKPEYLHFHENSAIPFAVEVHGI